MPVRTPFNPNISTPVIARPTLPVTPGLPLKPGGPFKPVPFERLPDVNPDISLGRGGATAANLIIKRTFDGLTPEAAAGKIRSALQTKVAPAKEKLVTEMINTRVRDMQVALNNVFTPGTPNRKFLESQMPATVRVLGTTSMQQSVVYEVTKRGGQPEFFTKGWSGGFSKLDKPPIGVIMAGQINLDPRQLKMDYVTWKTPGLAADSGTLVEL